MSPHPPASELDRLCAVPLVAVLGGVLAAVLVVSVNLAAFLFDVLMFLVLSPLALFGSVWSVSPELFVGLWIAITIGGITSSSYRP